MEKIKLSLIAEKFIGQANGVYTAFLEAVESLKKEPEIDLTVNKFETDTEVIHYHSIGLRYVLTSFFKSKRMIVSAHVVPDSFIGSLIFSRLWRPLAKHYLKFVYNSARMVIAVSPVVKAELEKLGVTSKINVLCNSVNRSKFKQDPEARKILRKKYNISEKDLVVLCVGQIQPRKGIFDFLESAKNLPEIKFVWVGGRPFGRLTADFDKMTEAVENAPKNVIFTGVINFDEMPNHYAMSDVYFMPSYQENFAFATVEASSVKLPLVLRDNVEYPETLFTHYLKGSNAQEFTEIIKQLYEDIKIFKKWQEESNILASKYTLKAYMKTLLSYYAEVKELNISKEYKATN
jgi:1,2-diacylglycerol-3-alpha-glucose alpha-1,2-galactosyltransferase